MKKLNCLLILTITCLSLFSFNTKKDLSKVIELKIPSIHKSNEIFSKSKIDLYKIETLSFDNGTIKGVVTVILDSKDKVLKMMVPEGFPKELYPQALLDTDPINPMDECDSWVWGTQWICKLAKASAK